MVSPANKKTPVEVEDKREELVHLKTYNIISQNTYIGS